MTADSQHVLASYISAAAQALRLKAWYNIGQLKVQCHPDVSMQLLHQCRYSKRKQNLIGYQHAVCICVAKQRQTTALLRSVSDNNRHLSCTQINSPLKTFDCDDQTLYYTHGFFKAEVALHTMHCLTRHCLDSAQKNLPCQA
jgi:hypothetical protein